MKPVTSVSQALTVWPVDQPDEHELRLRRARGGRDVPEPMQAVLAYDAADPYAMNLIFPEAAGGPVTWQFARALLIDGLTQAAGEGDVMVGPHEVECYLVFTLTPEERESPLTFYASRAVVAQFVDATFEAVPLGGEKELVEWDRELAALLGHQVQVTFREVDVFGRSRPGTLAADPEDHTMVVITVPSSAGVPVVWRISRDELAGKVEEARRRIRARARDVRLEVPGDAELLLGVGAVQEFLLARFTTVLDGAS